MPTLPERIADLEAQLAETPESHDFREELISAYLEEGLADAPARLEHILWFVRHKPTNSFTRCPLCHFPRDAAPAIFDAVEAAWKDHVASNPNAVRMTLGLAAFVAPEDRSRAISLLRDFAQTHPHEPEPWIDVGRYHLDAAERLQAFQKAEGAGSKHPNLLAWLARSAAEADDPAAAKAYGGELLAKATAARVTYSDKLDWPESGRALFARAEAATGSRADAQALADAISAHAFHKHWGHTAVGFAALKDGAVAVAVEHLLESSAIPGDYRLRSYGPSFLLASKLYSQGERDAVCRYLEACEAFWDAGVLRDLRQAVVTGAPLEFPST